MKKYTYTLYGLISLLLIGCSTNDYREEYQKDLVYDGYKAPMDTLFIETYNATIENDIPAKGKLYTKSTKWYDLNGYHSMSISTLYSNQGERTTTEKITRDKKSLPIARDIIIEATNTETAVTLSRLRKRNEGKEEWLFRHYLDPQKFLEDANTIFYTEDSKTTKKVIANSDSLIVIEIDSFNAMNRPATSKRSTQQGTIEHFLQTHYNAKGYIDSISVQFYKGDDNSQDLLSKYTESYTYDFDEIGNPIKSYTYHNDSLTYISDYRYAYRK